MLCLQRSGPLAARRSCCAHRRFGCSIINVEIRAFDAGMNGTILVGRRSCQEGSRSLLVGGVRHVRSFVRLL
jgi:deoxycytidylate deaminase